MWSPLESALLGKVQNLQRRGACGKELNIRRSRYAGISEKLTNLRESALERTQPKHYEDRIAGKGFNSSSHYNLLHQFIPVQQAMKIPDAEAAVDKAWEKFEKLPAWQMTKVEVQRRSHQRGSKKGIQFIFGTLMDICHLENSELVPKFQKKNKGRVVLRGDIVKNDSGSCAVCTEQGSSASQMTAAKVMDVIARLRGCQGQTADSKS